MMLSRRAFLGWAAAALPSAALVRRAHAAAVGWFAADPRALRALGEAILPLGALGAAGVAAAVASFQRWITDYRAGAELLHGYGTSRIRYAGPTPATRWAQQLDALDARARKDFGRAFADLPLERRRTIVRDALFGERTEHMPPVSEASHVAVALLAHFYDSAEAHDLGHEAQIGKNRCRPLAQSARRPLPLGRTS